MKAEPHDPPGALARGVLVAAGSSRRMLGQGGARKPLIEIDGRTLLEHVLRTFEATRCIESVVILGHADDLTSMRALVERLAAPERGPGERIQKVRAVLAGGAERADSVRIGCRADIPDERARLLCIHDAARPFVRVEEVQRVVESAAEHGAALLAIPVRDTLKHSDDGERVGRTVDRAPLWAAQTPQVFERRRFLRCLADSHGAPGSPTDDAALWEDQIGPVHIVRGSARNLKITEGDDLQWARAFAGAADPSTNP